MGFYQERVSILKPAARPGYGSTPDHTWDTREGATLVEVPFGVDFQPMTTATDGAGELTISSYRLHTPPGRGIDFSPQDRLVTREGQFVLSGDLGVWSSSSHPSGIDHVEADFKRVGAFYGR